MTKLKSNSLDLGYPIYGAKFVTNNILLTAGGGGEGNNGIPNKITALLVQPDNKKKPLKRYRELVLNDKEDCPMSLDANNGTILVGINENSMMIKKGVNKHLRKFKFHNEHLKFVESCQIHPSINTTHYQKITVISKDGLMGIIVMSDNPSSVYIVDTSEDLEEKFKIVTEGDVKDIGISPDGKLMCYITSSHFEAISTVTGRSVFKSKIDFTMSKVQFLDNNVVIIAGVKNNCLVVGEFSIAKSSIVKQSLVYKNLKGITSMDVNVSNGLIVLAGSDCSLLLIRTRDLKLIKKLNKVHNFAITKATFSQDGTYLASVSAANTVNVTEIPDKFSSSKSLITSLFQYLLSIILVAILSVGFQFLYKNGYLQQAMDKMFEVYNSYRPADSSNYFTIQPIGSTEIFTNGAPTTTTYIPTAKTIDDDIISISGDIYQTTIEKVIPTSVETFSKLESEDFLSEVNVDLKSATTGYSNISKATPSILEPKTIESISKIVLGESISKSISETKKEITTSDAIKLSESIKTTPLSTEPSVKTISPLSSSLLTREVTKEITREITKEVTATIVETLTEKITAIETSFEVVISTETVITSLSSSKNAETTETASINGTSTEPIETYVTEETFVTAEPLEEYPSEFLQTNEVIEDAATVVEDKPTFSKSVIEVDNIIDAVTTEIAPKLTDRPATNTNTELTPKTLLNSADSVEIDESEIYSVDKMEVNTESMSEDPIYTIQTTESYEISEFFESLTTEVELPVESQVSFAEESVETTSV